MVHKNFYVIQEQTRALPSYYSTLAPLKDQYKTTRLPPWLETYKNNLTEQLHCYKSARALPEGDSIVVRDLGPLDGHHRVLLAVKVLRGGAPQRQGHLEIFFADIVPGSDTYQRRGIM